MDKPPTWSYAINLNYAVLRVLGGVYTFRRYPGDRYDAILDSIQVNDDGGIVCDVNGMESCPIGELLALATPSNDTILDRTLSQSR